MNDIKRLVQLSRLSVFLSAVIWTGGMSFGNAAGYWTCSSDKWVAVGDPKHAMPSKVCGKRLETPGTQSACEQAGGRWESAGMLQRLMCIEPMRDADKPCGDNGECE